MTAGQGKGIVGGHHTATCPSLTPTLSRRARERGGERGFTLIEMMVVIVIIAVAAALVVPRLPAPEGTRLKNSARNIACGIRFLTDQAIVTKGIYHLHVNLAESSTRIAKVSTAGEEASPDDNFMNRRLIEDGIIIEDVTVPQLGKVTEGEVVISFGPSGASECIIFHLKGGEEHFTVIAYPSGGKVKVLEGYQEATT